MNHIRQFIAILGFCIIFGDRLKLPLCAKKVAVSDIITELTDFFRQILENGQILLKTVLRLKLSHKQLF